MAVKKAASMDVNWAAPWEHQTVVTMAAYWVVV